MHIGIKQNSRTELQLIKQISKTIYICLAQLIKSARSQRSNEVNQLTSALIQEFIHKKIQVVIVEFS